MNPVLTFETGGLAVHVTTYRFFMLAAAATVVGLGLLIAARRGLPWRQSLPCLLAAAAAVPVGARLFDLATKPDLYGEHPERLVATDLAGFSMFGGLILAAATGTLVCRWLRLDLARMADSVAPGLALGIALMRVGCFEAGCCFGKAADLPWAVIFPRGSEAHLHQIVGSGWLALAAEPRPVHPTQLYELSAALAGALLTSLLISRGVANGSAFLALVAWYSAFRLLNHLLRVPGAGLAVPEWFYPALYATTGLVALGALLWSAGRLHSIAGSIAGSDFCPWIRRNGILLPTASQSSEDPQRAR